MFDSIKRYCKRFCYVIKNSEGKPYLVRYRLIQRKHGTCVYLHHILLSDGDRALHDHPFDFTTILLWGSYIEWVPNADFLNDFVPTSIHRHWLSVIKHKATDPHRLALPWGPVWSLFIRGPKIRKWGFYVDNKKWVPHEDYTGQ